ncbi:MAG: DedA family protein [gamma proteobacterium symbiont of Bathyaustriella thionipta]|nr:DedA family protein [gamma proteobacterium symbiont of Bathyaustriella thionipta]MCU7951002.1 DedA family protein [gamma proteobacterium symbiont of Bathyaustriella thionipta]MCU7951843.1 DedA family protein [gamma proteobacterium symbiont of Bathyaustriella thionipta]MCU7957509.1 DedA family protein [gamma proteobacterium symbiont of Bathyaustriella thionipta]MCU7968203.1 DedA family protein [gamma proteobacterium symbiont of Bathyaustriella thionipta]
MKFFSKLYDKVMKWSRHPHAERYLAGLSFAESSFFPIPPDVMLAPMALAKTDKALRFALITTIASVAGGILGYGIGLWFFDLIQPLVSEGGRWEQHYLLTREWFLEWGFWAIFIAGFSPIPYKVFTITAGAIGMLFLPFVIASAIGRGARFFLVASLMKWGGKDMELKLKQYIDILGWFLIILGVIAYIIYKI